MTKATALTALALLASAFLTPTRGSVSPVALTAAFLASDFGPKTRIYVRTAESPSAATTEEQQGRQDSVRDLQDVLSGKSQFALVSTADDAQVVVEVLNREERDAPQGGFGGKSISRFRETIVRVRVTAGAEQGELKGIGRGSWTSAAKDAVQRLSKWVKNHRIADSGQYSAISSSG